MFVWVDALSPDCRIVKCSTNFAALIGPIRADSDMVSWIKNKDEFRIWVQAAANVKFSGAPWVSSLLNISIRPPSLSGCNVELRASCSLDFRDAPDLDINSESMPLCIVVHHIAQHQRRRRQHSQDKARGTRNAISL